MIHNRRTQWGIWAISQTMLWPADRQDSPSKTIQDKWIERCKNLKKARRHQVRLQEEQRRAVAQSRRRSSFELAPPHGKKNAASAADAAAVGAGAALAGTAGLVKAVSSLPAMFGEAGTVAKEVGGWLWGGLGSRLAWNGA